jgi:nitrite reductase (NO-forming)
MKRILLSVSAALALGMTAFALQAYRRTERVEAVDLGRRAAASGAVYPALLAPASDAGVKEFRIPIEHRTVTIADSVSFDAWTFGGTVPGPVVRVRQGDRVRIVLVNESPMPHSIDFHAARIPPNQAYRTIVPRQELTFEFVARDAGAYLVHCGTPPVSLHMLQGMYFPIIVDPKGGWPTTADKEFVLVQSEMYVQPAAGGSVVADWPAENRKEATYVVFNGRAYQYKTAPLQVDVGDRVRFFVVNAGPNFTSDFHIVGAIFDRVYPDGNPAHALEGVQTWGVPAGSGAVFETVFERGASDEGVYPFVTHAFADAEKGAVGLIRVGNPQGSMAMH